MVVTIGEIIDRIKRSVKGVYADALLTDRYVYSLMTKYAHLFLKQLDSKNRLFMDNSVFNTLPYVALQAVDAVGGGCADMSIGCTIRRTKHKLPKLFIGYNAPAIRRVSTIDGVTDFVMTTPKMYYQKKRASGARYNKSKYYWYLDGHLYFPDVDYDAVSVEAIFEEGICVDACVSMQEQAWSVPRELQVDIEQYVIKELSGLYAVPSDVNKEDNVNGLR